MNQAELTGPAKLCFPRAPKPVVNSIETKLLSAESARQIDLVLKDYEASQKLVWEAELSPRTKKKLHGKVKLSARLQVVLGHCEE